MYHIPKKIGKFEIDLRVVTNGQFGQVVAGRFQKSLGVNIYCCHKADFKADTTQLLLTQGHNNIIRYFDFEEDEQQQFIAFEQSRGTLEDLVCRRYEGPAIGTKKHWLKQITCGLNHLHNKSVLHLNLSPVNIIISERDGQQGPFLKLANFCLRKVAVKDEIKFFNWKDSLIFFPAWSAPEIHQENGFATYYLDIFSIGLLFGFVLTGGQHMFGKSNREAIDRIKGNKKMKKEVEEQLQKVSCEALSLIKMMVNSQPNERPKTEKILSDPYFQIEESAEEEAGPSSKKSRMEADDDSDDDCIIIDQPLLPSTHKLSLSYLPKDEMLSESLEEDDVEIVRQSGSDFIASVKQEPLETLRADSALTAEVTSSTISTVAKSETHTPKKDYSSYVKQKIQVGMFVRCIKSFGQLLEGDTGCVLYLEKDGDIDDLNVEVDWGKRGLQFAQYQQLEFIDASAVEETVEDEQPTSTSTATVNEERDEEEDESDEETDSSSDDESIITPPIPVEPSASVQNWNIAKCIELMEFCGREALDAPAIEHIGDLISREDVDINFKSMYKNTKSKNTPLLLLCRKNQSQSLYPAIKVLLGRDDIDLKYKNTFGHNSLSLVCRYYKGNDILDVIRLLVVKHGVSSTDAKDKVGRDALLLLCQYYQGPQLLGILELLLQSGSLAKYSSRHGEGFRNAALLVCSNYQRPDLIDIVRLLLEHGIDPNILDHVGDNALNLVCANYRGKNLLEVINVLLSNGITATIKNKAGHNAILLICSKQFDRRDLADIVRLLKRNLVDVNASVKGRKSIDFLKNHGFASIEIKNLLRST